MDPKTFLALNLGRIGGIQGDKSFGPWGHLGLYDDIGQGATAFTQMISRIIGIMTIIAGIWFIFQFIIGGYGFMTAGGDPKKMADATAKITSGLIGLVVIVAAYAITSLLGSLLGFDILNPQNSIQQLGP